MDSADRRLAARSPATRTADATNQRAVMSLESLPGLASIKADSSSARISARELSSYRRNADHRTSLFAAQGEISQHSFTASPQMTVITISQKVVQRLLALVS